MCSGKFEGRKRVRLLVFLGLSVLFFFAATMPEAAEDYPSKPITLIVGFPPGGTVGISSQIFVEFARKYLPKPQPIQIEYKPGASQAIGADFIFKQPADGHNVMAIEFMGLIDKMAKDSGLLHFKMEDFVYIGGFAYSPAVLAVNKESPFKRFDDFIDYAKKNPGKLSIGHAGIGSGSHFAGEVFQRGCGIKLNPVPFAGGGPLIPALLGGHIDCAMGATGNMGDHIMPGGGLRALVFLTPERWAKLPDVPTCMEKGYNVDRTSWYVLMAKKGTPKPILDVLHNVLKKTVDDPQVKEALIRVKFVPSYLGPAEAEKIAYEEFKLSKQIYGELGLLK
jgi:tripartite-type tricarboxylate transporter receptor subunit TctC